MKNFNFFEVEAPVGFDVSLTSEGTTTMLTVRHKDLVVLYERSEDVKNGRGKFVLKAPKEVDVKVDSSRNGLTIVVTLDCSLSRLYTRKRVMNAISQIEDRNALLGTAKISALKLKDLGKDFAVVWALTNDGRILKEKITFHKLEDLTLDKNSRLGYYLVSECEEVLSEDDDRAQKFNNLKDAWN